MFEWLKRRKQELKKEPKPYVPTFKPGDRVETIWNFYNDGCSKFQRLLKEDHETWIEDNPEAIKWDIFSILIEKGKTGTVVGNIRDSVVLEIDGFPFKVIVIECGLKKIN